MMRGLTLLRGGLHFLAHLREGQHLALELAAWLLALLWILRTRRLMLRLGDVPDLSLSAWDLCPARAPGVVVVVPARNEAAVLQPAMETLLAQDYPWLRVVGVDDRSTDRTGDLLDEMAAAHPDRLSVLHITELAEGWIGKTFAMEAAAVSSRSEWLLFTDADVWFSPSLLRRVLAAAEMRNADHLVVVPTMVTTNWRERFYLAFLSVVSLWAVQPWKVADRRSRWSAVGAGAFNLVRRDAWEEIGGFAPQRLAVIEDLTLGRRIRAAGMRQEIAFAPGLLPLHWATGLRGLVRGTTKNFFALMNFRLFGLLLISGALLVLFLAPLPLLVWPPTVIPALVILGCIGVHYREMAEVSGLEARWAWLYPAGVFVLLWAMLRSAGLTLWRRGVRWRETFYPLRELKAHNSPFTWELEAALHRAERRRVVRGMHPPLALRLLQRVRKRRAAAGTR